MAELADAPDLGSGAARHAGSTPVTRTTASQALYRLRRFFMLKKHLALTPLLRLFKTQPAAFWGAAYAAYYFAKSALLRRYFLQKYRHPPAPLRLLFRKKQSLLRVLSPCKRGLLTPACALCFSRCAACGGLYRKLCIACDAVFYFGVNGISRSRRRKVRYAPLAW